MCQKTFTFNRYADKISVGDELLVENKNELVPAKVINVSNNQMQGMFYFNIIYSVIYRVFYDSTTIHHCVKLYVH